MMPFPKKPTMRMITCAFLSGGAIGAAISFVQVKEVVAEVNSRGDAYERSYADQMAEAATSADAAQEMPGPSGQAK